MQKIIKLSKDSIFYLWVFIVIYFSHDTILFGTNQNERFITIRKIVPFMLAICLLLMQRAMRVKKEDLFVSLVTLALPVLSCLINREDVNNYIYRAVIMICAMLVVWNGWKMKFFRMYNRIMYLLSIWSIGTYLLRLCLPGVVSMFPKVYITTGTSYYFMGFSLVNSELHYGIVRNSSIFREPGMFCVMLAFALLIERIILKQKRKGVLGIMVLAMITTYSTAGFFILALLFIYYVLFEKGTTNKIVMVVLGVVAVGIMVAGTDLLSADGAIFSKFTKGSDSYGSWMARWSSITESINITLKNPLFGIGRYALYDVVLNVSGVYRAVDNTNTILVGFAAYGLLFGSLISLGCWRFIRNHQKNLIAALFLFMVLIMALSNEDVGQNIVFYILVFTGLCHDDKEARYQRSNA